VIQFDAEESSFLSEFLDKLPLVKTFLQDFPKESDAQIYLVQRDQAVGLMTELYKEAFEKGDTAALAKVRQVAEDLTQDSVFTDPEVSQHEKQIRAGIMAQLGYQISAMDPAWLFVMSSRLSSPEGRQMIENIKALQEQNILESNQ
jgi:hypothetical protein